MLSPEHMKLKKIEEKDGKATFKLGPLPQGYGHTIANSFRRVLLSSIMGAAPTQVSIKGAAHEFSVIKGIKEDAFQILLNIKGLNLKIKSEDFEEVKITVKKKGVGPVLAKDLEMPSNVEVSNPDHVICNITEASATFDAEIFAKNGYGYTTSDEARKAGGKSGVIYLDSSFSPVKFVNYTVANTRLGKQTDLDEITLEIETDSTITPLEATKKSAAMLREFFAKIAEGETVVIEEQEEVAVVEEAVDEKTAKAKEIMIDELNLPTRTINALKKHNIQTLKDLSEMDEDRLLSVRNLGEKSILEIKKLLKKEGLNS
jgi:DNA-directed RNA polymerase subunit alpha